MIDEKINKALSELETNLRNLESAREQVEKTVKSYTELSSATSEYVNNLSTITSNIQSFVNSIGADYSQKASDFEKDRDAIINASKDATEKLSNTTEEYKKSLSGIHLKLLCCLIITSISLVAIGVIVFLRLK